MNKYFQLFFSLILVFLLTSCSHIFELKTDVLARQALFDLMKIQEKFYQENNRYTGNLAEIDKYNLTYDTGLVYMEIEKADKDGYRAISLPAESTTARVFAFDTKQGGFYEMQGDEVARYVLGALRQIREEKRKKEISDLTAWLMLIAMVFVGLRFTTRFKSKENYSLLGAYFFCLFPLGWSIAILGKMEKNIVFSQEISQFTWAALILAFGSFILGIKWMLRIKEEPSAPSLLSLMVSSFLIAIISAGVMIHTLATFS